MQGSLERKEPCILSKEPFPQKSPTFSEKRIGRFEKECRALLPPQ